MADKIKTYECMFLLDTNKVAGDVASAQNTIHTILERNQAEILASRPWDERRLAYPINNQKKALYYLTCFKAAGSSIPGIERDCQLNEMILRQMILLVNPKLEEAIVGVAKEEHGVALQTVHDTGDDDLEMDDGAGVVVAIDLRPESISAVSIFQMSRFRKSAIEIESEQWSGRTIGFLSLRRLLSLRDGCIVPVGFSSP